jgi:hypothetical protein
VKKRRPIDCVRLYDLSGSGRRSCATAYGSNASSAGWLPPESVAPWRLGILCCMRGTAHHNVHDHDAARLAASDQPGRPLRFGIARTLAIAAAR